MDIGSPRRCCRSGRGRIMIWHCSSQKPENTSPAFRQYMRSSGARNYQSLWPKDNINTGCNRLGHNRLH